jgi:ubiquinone/menaquinone biosynthesis C-methylase UbiE
MSDPEIVRHFEYAGCEQAAEKYETSIATATMHFIQPLLDAAGVSRDGAVLDIATGPGVVAGAANARGLDFSPAMLRVAGARHPSTEFDHGDAEALPYPAAHFD